jgi:putative redox protein
MTAPNVRQVRLEWAGEGLVFRGGPDGGPQVTVDSDASEGPSSTHTLLIALAACRGMDGKLILDKSRVRLDSIAVEAIGVRADEPPRKFVSIALEYDVRGPGPGDAQKVQRALDLSRDKYCSVLHSLDPGIQIDIRVRGE